MIAEGDEARLEQVVANLLSNAVKYSPAGGLVEVVVRCEQSHAVLEVIDRGIGVPAEERDQLFAPFSADGDGGGHRHRGDRSGPLHQPPDRRSARRLDRATRDPRRRLDVPRDAAAPTDPGRSRSGRRLTEWRVTPAAPR